MEELDAYISRVKHLPPAPQVLPKLLALLGQPDTDAAKVVELITHEPALTASVLQRCNSAYFGATEPATDVDQAVARLGFNQVYRMTAAVIGSQSLSPAQKSYGFGQGDLWRHSVAAAVAAQNLAADKGDDENLVFTAALLHDIGKIILADALEDKYTRLVQQSETNQQSLVEVEKSLLGVQHAEIGGRLLARWKFPANLVAAVWFHHRPSGAAAWERLAAYVYLGNMIAHFMGFSYGHQAFAFRGRAEALVALDLRAEELPHYMIQAFERIETIEALLNLAN
jgi:putative nucleotidyltransferase with HDIG domain